MKERLPHLQGLNFQLCNSGVWFNSNRSPSGAERDTTWKVNNVETTEDKVCLIESHMALIKHAIEMRYFNWQANNAKLSLE